MTIEFKPGRYFVGIWAAAFDDGNVLGSVWSDDQKEWHLQYRFRYIKDDKLGPASADEFRKYSAHGPDKAVIVKATHAMFDAMTEEFGWEIEYQPIEEDGCDWFERYEKLGLLPNFFTHTKTLPKGTEPDDPDIDWEQGWTEPDKSR